jgi:hypothetical protein
MRGEVTNDRGEPLGGLTSNLWHFGTPTLRPPECLVGR